MNLNTNYLTKPIAFTRYAIIVSVQKKLNY